MDNSSEHDVADRLVAELAGEGDVVDEGGFDIDAGRALVKLSQFQLADPRSYVLRLAEAGLLSGASQLRFDIRAASITASFDRAAQPVGIDLAVLERLTSVLVSRAPLAADAPTRAMLIQLAVAVLAITRLDPTYLAIESVGTDGRGHRRVYAPEHLSEPLADAEPGLRIYVVERVQLGRALDDVVGLRHEQELLEHHCRFAQTPIFLDGRRISGKPVLDRPICAAPVVDARGEVIGEAGFVAADEQPAHVHWLSHGLLIESQVLYGCEPGFVAAIDLPLARDLTQAAIARSPELDAALEAVCAVHARLAPQAKSAHLQRSKQNSALVRRLLGLKRSKPWRASLLAGGATYALFAVLVLVLDFSGSFGWVPALSLFAAVVAWVAVAGLRKL